MSKLMVTINTLWIKFDIKIKLWYFNLALNIAKDLNTSFRLECLYQCYYEYVICCYMLYIINMLYVVYYWRNMWDHQVFHNIKLGENVLFFVKDLSK